MAVVVWVAASVDGFIAGPRDELNFLDPYSPLDYGSDDLLARVGALVMGRRTYEITRGMGGPWPYGDKPVYVLGRFSRDEGAPRTVRGWDQPIEQLVRHVRAARRGDLWIVGGGITIASFLDGGLVDELEVFTLPVLLGGGVPLFAERTRIGEQRLALLEQATWHSGVVRARWRLRRR